MTIPVSNVDSNSQTFGAWLSITNKMARLFTQNTVTSDASVGGSVTTGNAYVNGYFGANYLTVKTGVVGGNLTGGGNVSVISNADFSSYVTANGPVSFANTLVVTGNVSFSNTFKVIGTANLASTVNVGGALNVSGITTISNTASVTGNLVISGTANVTGNVSFSNNANVSGSLYVTNTASLSNSLSVSGNAVFSGTANVTGAVTLSSTLSVTGNTVLSGTANVSGNLSVTSTANVGGALNVTGNTTVSGSANVSGNLNVSGIAAVTGNVSANSFLGNGNFITTLNASAVSTGTLPDARLSSAVVNTSGSFTITGLDTFQANLHTGNSTVNTQISNSVFTINSSNTLTVNSSTINMGNSSVNSTMNLTGFLVNGLEKYTNATNISSGTLAFARLPANAVFWSNTNTFVALQTFQANLHSGNSTVNAQYSNASIVINNSNVLTVNASSVSFGNASANVVANLSGLYINGAEKYINATNITTGTLPYAQLGSAVVNTSAAFTITGIHTHNANVIANAASVLVQNATTVSVINTTGVFVGNTTTNVVIANTTSSFGGNVVVTGTANVTGAVTFSNTLSATGAVTFSNNLTVANTTNTVNLNVTGYANIVSLNISDAAATSVVNGNFTVVGVLSAGTLATTLQTNGSIIPTTTKTFDLGSGANSWLGVYSANVFATNLVSTSNLSTTSLYTASANVSGTTNTTSLLTVTANVSGNLGVQGVISASSNVAITGSANVSGNVVLGGAVLINGVTHIASNTYTFSNSLLQANVDQVSASTYRSIEYLIQLSDTSLGTPQYHSQKISIVHDGTTPIMTEYAMLYTTSSLGVFDSVINGGNVILKLTPTTANVVVKYTRTAMVV